MSVYGMNYENRKRIASIFRGWDETMIWSCLQGYMGSAWTDSLDSPKSAQIVIGDFCFLGGSPYEELVKNVAKENKSGLIIMVPQDEKWSKLIERIYGMRARRVTRYATKKEADVFDKNKLILHTIME